MTRPCAFPECKYRAYPTYRSADGKWSDWICGNPNELHLMTVREPGTRRCDAEKAAR
jgi:hypothetical protein